MLVCTLVVHNHQVDFENEWVGAETTESGQSERAPLARFAASSGEPILKSRMSTHPLYEKCVPMLIPGESKDPGRCWSLRQGWWSLVKVY